MMYIYIKVSTRVIYTKKNKNKLSVDPSLELKKTVTEEGF